MSDGPPGAAAPSSAHPREAERLSALAGYGILDTPREPAFDDLAALASEICETPVALVSLIAEGRQWFKAEVGLGERETPLDTSFCAQALLEDEFLEVPDAREDPRFAGNPLVAGEPGFRFYAGALLKTGDGLPIGTLCVLDTRPRRLSAWQTRTLGRLARQAMSQLELRLALRARTRSEERLRFLDAVAAATQALTDPTRIMATTARLLGEHLQVAVCAYADLEPDQDGFTIRGDWTAPGAASIVGSYRLRDFGAVAAAELRAGRPLVTRDTLAELGPEQAALFLQLGLRATVCMPLVKDGRLTAMMAVHAAAPRPWQPDELALIRDTTERSWAHIERTRSEAALREREERLRLVVESARDYAIITTDAERRVTGWSVGAEAALGWPAEAMIGRPADAIFTPRDRAEGVPEREALTARREGCAPDERWHQRADGELVFLNGSMRPLPGGERGGERGLIKIARDETERRRGDERRMALVALADRLRDLEDPADLSYAAAELLGRTLGVSRAGYGSVDPAAETITIARDWTAPGIRSLAGVLHFRDYGSYIDDLKRGGTVVFADARQDPRTAAHAGALEAISARAVVNMPLTEAGGLVALLYLNHAAARHWSEDELAFVREVAERTRMAVERRRAEASLRASEAKFQAIADSVDQMIWSTRPDGFHDYYNQRWYDYTGVPGGSTDGEAWAGLFHPDDQERAWAVWRHSLATGELYHIEYRLRHRSGQYRWVIGRAQCVRDAEGRIVRWYGTCTDVHDLKIAEERLRESEARYRTLFDSIESGFCVAEVRFDAPDGRIDYRIVEANPAFERHTGLVGAEGRWLRAFAPGLEEHWYETYGRIARTGVPERFEQGSAALGRWFDVYAFRVGDPQEHRVAILFNDISARRNAEERLRELNETLEAQVAARTAERDRVWRNSRDLLGVADAEGRWLSINPAWGRVLGWRDEEILDRTSEWLEHPDDRDRTRAEVAHLAAGGTTFAFENRFLARDGGYRWLSWTAAPEEGLLYCSGRDVTADRESQAELALAQEQLRQAQKMEAVGQLTGGVAHDFNNLLTIIKSSTDLLRRPGLAEERRRRYVDAISDTVDRAARLTGQLLAFARRQALKPEVFDASERIQTVTDMLRTIVGSRIQITTEIVCAPCFVEADASQFETALVNMTVNARDAMQGEGRLTVRVAGLDTMPPIRGHSGGRGPFVAVSIADTGAGIPPDRIGQIFEPFFTTKEVGKGTGLGLSQVYGFAKQSGGDVEVASRVGQGTTFTLYLPRAEADRGGPGPEVGGGPEPAENGRGRRVLVVEDNVEVGTFSTQILQDLGYETTWAANADEALQLLAGQGGFDVVFSDVVMPGMSGVELAQEIRRRYPGLPVVLTSGYSHVLAEEGRHGFELLHKPYAAEELSRVLRRVTRAGPAGAGRGRGA